MSAKRTSVDFGDRSLEIDVPEHATVVEFDDPGALSHPAVAAREAIENPYGAPPLKELAKPGMRVAVGFDDPTRPARTVQIILPVVVDALLRGGRRGVRHHFRVRLQQSPQVDSTGTRDLYGTRDLQPVPGRRADRQP